MAAKSERERKLKAVLSFASGLPGRFTAPHEAQLRDELQSFIRKLPLPNSASVASKHEELDRCGTELWNLATRLLRAETSRFEAGERPHTHRSPSTCLLRVFAFLLLDTAGAQLNGAQDIRRIMRLLRIALKTARVCIEHDDLENASKVLERATVYHELMKTTLDAGIAEGAHEARTLLMDYSAARILLAWKQNRLDTADHMYLKIHQVHHDIDAETVERYAEFYHELGKDLLEKCHYESAVKWFERAHNILGEKELGELGHEAGELDLSIMLGLAQAFLKLDTEETVDKAWNMVNILEAKYGDRMSVQLLRLELLSAIKSNDSNQFYSVLHRMARSVVMNETNFRTILSYVHKLKDMNNVTACKLIDELLELRLVREENQRWIERAVITRLWIVTTTPAQGDKLQSIHNVLDLVLQKSSTSFGSPATHASHTLLWKCVERAYEQEQFELAESWCRMCLHPLFDKAGEHNKSRITRKLATCALSRQDYATAQSALSSMSEVGQSEMTTKYLMYKTALRVGDELRASQCLDQVCRLSSKDVSLLYACVLEAQSCGDKKQELLALRKVLDKYECGAPTGVNMPALLRCTIRLMSSELIKDGSLQKDILDTFCITYERAGKHAQASRSRPSTSDQQLFTPSEFEWFSKTAYNVSIKYCAQMPPQRLVCLVNACITFIGLLETQHRPHDKDLPFRSRTCHYLNACALTTMARAEDNIHDCLQHYLRVRKHAQEFRKIVGSELQSISVDKNARQDMKEKHFQMIKLELEAVLKLEEWNALDGLFEECWKHSDIQHLETIADLVLVIQSCVARTDADADARIQTKLLSVLQKIISITWKQTDHDIMRLSRWIRCLFQLSFGLDESISLACVERAAQIAAAKKVVSVQPDTFAPIISLPTTPPPSSSPYKYADGDKEANHYPTTELEWLATSSFNHAVDYYVQENEERMRLWAENAIALAQWADDDGTLRNLLMEKYSQLSWAD